MMELNIVSNCCQPRNELQDSRKLDDKLPIVIIGAGPVGLAAAAHLLKYKQKVVILEVGSEVGSNILTWGHIKLFSQWKYNIDKTASSLLKQQGWLEPNLEELPTGKDLVEKYLLPLSNIPEIKTSLFLNTRAISIGKKNIDKMKSANRRNIPFIIYTERNNSLQKVEACAVIDATGTWGNPNPASSNGIWMQTERTLKHKIFYGIPDILNKNKSRYQNKKVAVIGSGHSAINVLLDLAALKEMHSRTEVVWIIRKPHVEETYGGEENDALEARGMLGSRIHELVDKGQIQVYTSFQVEQLLEGSNGSIQIKGEVNEDESMIDSLDEVIVNTGNRPNYLFLSELRTKIDYTTESVEALAPLIDPNLHSCGTVRPHGERELRQPEDGLYIVGSKSYGRAPTFLMATGYEQVRSIAAYISGDKEASEKVELDLPETGVCKVNFLNTKNSSDNCDTNSCCS